MKKHGEDQIDEVSDQRVLSDTCEVRLEEHEHLIFINIRLDGGRHVGITMKKDKNHTQITGYGGEQLTIDKFPDNKIKINPFK